MNWDEAVEEAKDELGYGDGYLRPYEWEEVVERAKEILSEERDEDYHEYVVNRNAQYLTYIKSTEWAIKRKKRLTLDKGQCQDCGDKAEHVHHLNYDRLGAEKIEDLISLCHKCHGARHGK